MSALFSEEEESVLVQKLDDQSIAFHEEVSRESVLVLIRLINECMNTQTPDPMTGKRRVYLYVHSEGGDLYAGLSAYDHIKNVQRTRNCEIVTIMDGITASAATLIYLAGKTRSALPNSCMLIHQMRGSVIGKLSDIKDDLVNSEQMNVQLIKIYLKHSNTKLNEKKIENILKREKCLSVAKCLKYGLVHSSIDDS